MDNVGEAIAAINDLKRAPSTSTSSYFLTSADPWSLYDGVPVRVMKPEYLIALYREESARTRKRLARVEALLEEGTVDESKLKSLVTRFKLRLP